MDELFVEGFVTECLDQGLGTEETAVLLQKHIDNQEEE